MPAYIIFIRTEPVKDPEAMAEYKSKSRQGKPSVSLRPLAIYGALTGLEGPVPDGVVMLEFEDVESAKAWYDSPDYQAAVPHRLKAADYTSFIVEGV